MVVQTWKKTECWYQLEKCKCIKMDKCVALLLYKTRIASVQTVRCFLLVFLSVLLTKVSNLEMMRQPAEFISSQRLLWEIVKKSTKLRLQAFQTVSAMYWCAGKLFRNIDLLVCKHITLKRSSHYKFYACHVTVFKGLLVIIWQSLTFCVSSTIFVTKKLYLLRMEGYQI